MNIVFLTNSFGFPNGMAATQRTRLLGQALQTAGTDVRVLILSVSEKPNNIQNQNSEGKFKGISFEYTTGTTIRSENFLIRRLVQIKGFVNGIFRIVSLKARNQIDILYMWGIVWTPTFYGLIFCLLGKLLRIPMVFELNEAPWPIRMKLDKNRFRSSPLWGATGVITISKSLTEWAWIEITKYKFKCNTLEIPILIDPDEYIVSSSSTMCPNVLYAGSVGYLENLEFILDAMELVWARGVKCLLVITGFGLVSLENASTRSRIEKLIQNQSIKLLGYINREDLLKKYSEANALLIPMFDDPRSINRFPTKIGEYLASGKPVITNSIGEISRYLVNNDNAIICPPGDVVSYSCAIIDVIQNSGNAQTIGRRGRLLAESLFNYINYSKQIFDFLRDISQMRGAYENSNRS